MTVAQGTPRLDVTREQIEEFRREQWMPTGNKPLEPWAVEENRVLTALCDYALQGVTEGTRLACEHEVTMDELGRQEYFKRKALEAENAALSAEVVELQHDITRHIAIATEHVNRVVELQKDAERYKVLRNGDLDGWAFMLCAEDDQWLSLDGDELDARIDALSHSSVTRASVPPSVKDSGNDNS